MNITYLLLGSNLNNRSALLQRAKEAISSKVGKITRESSVYESEPWGFQSEHHFLNQVVKVETSFKPVQILHEILQIEAGLGRIRADGRGYESRSIDIDILFYNDEIVSEEKLTIPHPKIQERMFTLVPLSEMDRSMIHPGLRKSIAELIKECPDKLNVYPYSPNVKQ